MTEKPDAPKPVPASDEKVDEFFDLLQSFGCETGRVNGKLMGRCSVCFGPWFDPENTADPIKHDDDCSTVTGPSILARIDQDRATIASERARADKAEQEVERLTAQTVERDAQINRCYEAEVTENASVRAQLSEARAEIARLRDALIRLRDCDWTISLPDRMDAVRDIARAALKPEAE